ncbi:MAG: hypothetical protein OEY19_13400 [Gammaproteobacteria bacterium]|nr:hypothetical protein [Gammaproteobacteria bacterium]MDH5630467.1 hypothetical protein [Gammaproteobacteria bacterium]
MENQFYNWDDFINNFGKEMVSAENVYLGMVESGLKDFAMSEFDFHFVSDKKENLEELKKFLEKSYPYKVDNIKKYEDLWDLSGVTNKIPVTQELLLYWALDMAKRGYEFDAKLDGYGSPIDPKNPILPDLARSKEDYYFDKGIDAYNAGDLSGAIINWTLVIEINPDDPNSYYSRAIVKNELYTWKAALRDYDKAIELAPKFISALNNRGSLKDENGDYEGAINDYNRVIELSDKDIENKQMAYFNRGNSRFNMKDKDGACKDWNMALELGAAYASERIDKYCKIKNTSNNVF